MAASNGLARSSGAARAAVMLLYWALRCDGESKFHVEEYSILSLVRVDLTCLLFVLPAWLARVFLKGIQGSVQAYPPPGPGGCPSCPGGYLFAQSADPLHQSVSLLYRSVLTAA